MRYAILGDIHGNLEALNAVLKGIGTSSVDAYLCVGDLVGYGPSPSQCVSRIRRLGCKVVAGNHDWAVIGRVSTAYFNPEARESVFWTMETLDNDGWNFLKELPLVYVDDNLTMVHGSPVRPEDFDYILSVYDARICMEAFDTEVCFVGHSHVPAVFIQREDGEIELIAGPEISCKLTGKAIINVGSVGQPRDHDPRAAYCIYDSDTKTVDIIRVEYDIAAVQEKIRRAGLPELNAYRLSLGM